MPGELWTAALTSVKHRQSFVHGVHTHRGVVNKSISTQLDLVTKERDDLLEQLKRLTSQFDKASACTAELERKLAAMTHERDELLAQLEGMASRFDNSTEREADLELQLDAMTKERDALRAQLAELQVLKLDGCIGCGCLSLPNCHLYNPEDRAAERGQAAYDDYP